MRTHLVLQLPSHPILLIGLYDNVEVIQILDDEAILFV